MTRQEANREILKLLSEEIERFPHGRFHQILFNMYINEMDPEFKDGRPTGRLIPKDLHHEESSTTLKRIKTLYDSAIKTNK